MSGDGDEAALTLGEAVPLLQAVLAHVAESVGVRCLAIKGPALVAQGLRDPARTSVDVDVLVEPAGFDALRAALERIGWHDDGFYDTPGIVPVHSVNHRHPRWPCELDVHRWFPGFLADPAEVFDVLWQRRETVSIAHHLVPAPDPVAHIAVTALHALRDQAPAYAEQKVIGLVADVRRTTNTEQLDDLARLAAETGASDTLRPLLDGLGVTPLPSSRPIVVPLADWSMRSQMEVSEVVPWLVGWSRTPWRRRPAYLWHAVWLGDEQFVAWDRSLAGSRRAVMGARLRRLRRAGRALPRAWRDYRKLTRERR